MEKGKLNSSKNIVKIPDNNTVRFHISATKKHRLELSNYKKETGRFRGSEKSKEGKKKWSTLFSPTDKNEQRRWGEGKGKAKQGKKN